MSTDRGSLRLDAAAPVNVLASTALSRAYLLRDIANYVATSDSAHAFEPRDAMMLVMPLIEDVKTLVEALQKRIEADRQAEAQAEGDHGE